MMLLKSLRGHYSVENMARIMLTSKLGYLGKGRNLQGTMVLSFRGYYVLNDFIDWGKKCTWGSTGAV